MDVGLDRIVTNFSENIRKHSILPKINKIKKYYSIEFTSEYFGDISYFDLIFWFDNVYWLALKYNDKNESNIKPDKIIEKIKKYEINGKLVVCDNLEKHEEFYKKYDLDKIDTIILKKTIKLNNVLEQKYLILLLLKKFENKSDLLKFLDMLISFIKEIFLTSQIDYSSFVSLINDVRKRRLITAKERRDYDSKWKKGKMDREVILKLLLDKILEQ